MEQGKVRGGRSDREEMLKNWLPPTKAHPPCTAWAEKEVKESRMKD